MLSFVPKGMHNGSKISEEFGVMVVVPNYRESTLGFGRSMGLGQAAIELQVSFAIAVFVTVYLNLSQKLELQSISIFVFAFPNTVALL